MTELNFDYREFSNIKSIEIKYFGLDGKDHFVRADIKTVSISNMTVCFVYENNFNLNCPQQLNIKYVIENTLYSADVTATIAKKADKYIYLTILSPERVRQMHQRKYYRINMKRTCILVGVNKSGQNEIFSSKTIDLSAGGVLMHDLESMFSTTKRVTINPYEYVSFHIILFLDIDLVLNLSARYVRIEYQKQSCQYAFEFINMKQGDIDLISKYVTGEQVKQLNEHQKMI